MAMYSLHYSLICALCPYFKIMWKKNSEYVIIASIIHFLELLV